MLAEKLLQCVKGSIAVSNWMIGLKQVLCPFNDCASKWGFFQCWRVWTELLAKWPWQIWTGRALKRREGADLRSAWPEARWNLPSKHTRNGIDKSHFWEWWSRWSVSGPL